MVRMRIEVRGIVQGVGFRPFIHRLVSEYGFRGWVRNSSRGVDMELEGEEGFRHLEEYSDGATERGRNMRNAICEKLHLSSLEYQSLDGILEAIGLEPCKVCTYCWNGKE